MAVAPDLRITNMNLKKKAIGAVALAVLTLTLCACSDNQKPTPADSAGLPAGWTGHYQKLGTTPNAFPSGNAQAASTK